MENQTIQNSTPEPIQTVNQTPAKINNPLVIILSVFLLIAVGIAGLFYFQIQKLSKELSKYQVQTSPAPTATPDSTADWKTYTNTKMGFELKYPQGKIVEESMIIPNNGLQTTIDLNGVNLLILKRSNINPVTNFSYKSLAEFDPRVSNFSSFTLNGLNAKDSGQYKTQAGTTQRDIILLKDTNIWIIQEISSQKDVTIPFDQIISTFKFLD